MVLAALLWITGCGVPVDQQPSALPDDSLPAALSSTTPTPVPDPEPSGVAINLFLFGEDGRLVEVPVNLPSPVTIQDVLEALIASGDDEELVQDQPLRSALPAATTVLGTERDGEVLTINLGPEGLFEIDDPELQLQALAQLVYTATGLESVEGVLLAIEGELRPLPTADGDPTEGQRPVTRTDYESLA